VAENPITANTGEHGPLLRQALRAVEQMKRKLDAAESRNRQPIAIIGMGCRFPGEANDAESFWELLRNGREAITEVPSERWKIDEYYDPDATKPGKMVTRFGGFLSDVDRFDAAFFGVAPREAAMMDPQQRILLEVTWQALESGGIAPRSLTTSKTGIYLGIASGDYAQMQLHVGDAGLLDVHFASGNSHSIASGRLSYLLGLKGPSVSIDTACSSSLVAVHLACQALRAGECTMAIAGGVNVILAPETTVALSQAHMLAPDGRSKVFDDRADGFARAEGCGVVILKPLQQAEKDGDRILAVIRGTALNQDGASSSLTAPNGPSQEELMRSALLNAGRNASQIGYVEAHGTGTSLGDPIELRALGAVYGASRTSDNPLHVGSLKTNFGHMEAAAGVGGLIKLVLALQHGEIPAHLQLKIPTTHVNWDQLRLTVSRATIPWPRGLDADGKPMLRVGAVSSFGFSGTNAHLIVEQGPAELTPEQQGDAAKLMLFSARSETALRDLASSYRSWLSSARADEYAWPEIAATAAVGRDHFRHRAAFVARSKEEAATSLNQLLSKNEIGIAAAPSSLCFLFTGQGSERSGMGLELLEQSEVFRSAIKRLDVALEGRPGQSIASIWANGAGELERASLVQPALYAYGWALSELWKSSGVEPLVVLGHSLGEYIAATVAGVMTPEEGVRLVAARGRLTEQLGEPGGMIAIVATEGDVRGLLQELQQCEEVLSIAAVNGPASVVVSGRTKAIETLEDALRLQGLRHKRLRTTHGFHSAALEPMLDAFEAEAAKVQFRIPEVRWISNLTGLAVERKQPVDARYWRRHLRETVQFERSLAAANAAGAGMFVEVGTEPQLLALAEPNGIANDRLIPSMSKGGAGGDWHKLLTAAGRLYTQGVDLDWRNLSEGLAFRKVSLPGYPFQRQRFWFDQVSRRVNAETRVASNQDRAPSVHPLLGSRLRTHAGPAIFHAELSPENPSHLGDHVVMGRRILPGAAYLEMAIAAARRVEAESAWTVTEVEFREPCVFDEPVLLETVLLAVEATGRRRFEIASSPARHDHAWTLHATGYVQPAIVEPENSESEDLLILQSGASLAMGKEAFYRRFTATGLSFGPAFQPIQQAWGNAEDSLVEVQMLPAVLVDAGQYILHPVILDACLQAAAALADDGERSALALPAAVANFRLLGDATKLRYARARVRKRQGRGLTVDIDGLDADGRRLLSVEALTLVEAAQEQYAGWLHEVIWERLNPDGAESSASKSEPVAIDVIAWHRELGTKAQQMGLDQFDRWMSEFDALCAAWIVKSFEAGGFVLTAGRVFDLAALIGALRIAPQHRRLAKRFLEILVEFGYLEIQEREQYRSLGKAYVNIEPISRRLAESAYPEMAWAERTAGKLLPLLRGEVTPVDALFSDGGQQIATRLYRDSVVARTFNPALVFAATQAAKSFGSKARVLEVGGGTGATTSYLIPALTGKITEYVWTDLGAGFVSTARREFGHLPAMRFQTLDLERDPATQAMSGESFDIIVASNVIHATADLRQALRHVRSLLRPGGVLLLAETIGKKQPWVDLTVGFTEGWWRFSDHDLRPDYPLISRSAWVDLLRESGFGEVSLAPGDDDLGDGSLSRQCLIAARASWSAFANASNGSQLMIVTSAGESSTLAAELQRLAQADGIAVTIALPAEVSPAFIEDWFGRSAEGSLSHREKSNIFYLPGAELASASLDHALQQPLDWQQEVLGGALQLTQALLAADRQADCRLWLVSRGAYGPEIDAPDGATLAAFTRSVNAEYANAHVVAVDLPSGDQGASELWSLCQSGAPKETHYALRGAEAWVPRLSPRVLVKTGAAQQPVESTGENRTRRLHFSATGLLEDLQLRMEERRPPANGEVEIAIKATAVNFHEVLSVLSPSEGALHNDVAPGGECSGVVARVGEDIDDLQTGDEVVAIGWGLMADFATLSRSRLWKVPTGMSAEDAATLLIPFLTARWSLEHVAKLQPGERVLIHAGAGGVGLAAIQEAQRLGAIVLATAGSEVKRAYLRSLGVGAVFDSRSTSFEQGVLEATGFQGVDVVLNSLAAEKIAAGMRTLAPGGRFIELGEKTVLTDAEATAMRPDVSYSRVHLRAALAAATPEIRNVIASVLADVEGGVIRPLPWKRFALDHAADAFRYMASGRHTGRVLLAPGDASHKARHQFSGFRRDGAYVVTGGFSGLGLLVVEWLVQQGAGCVLALGRGERAPDATAIFARLNDQGACLVSRQCDVSDGAALRDVLLEIPSQFTLRGVFHSAGALDDAALPQQTMSRFRSVLSPKVAGAWNLHRLTLSAPLDCFVLFSSAAGVFGSRGQSNHAAANAYLDALAHFRRERLGLPALSINWGAWSEVGAAVRHGVVQRSEGFGVSSIPPEDGLRLLGRLLQEDVTQVLVSKVNWRKWAETSRAEAAANADLLKHVLREHDAVGRREAAQSSESSTGANAGSWRAELLAAAEARRMQMLEARVEDRIRTVLSLSETQSIDPARPLQEYGLDSLLSIELRNALSADLDAKLSATALFDYPTLAALTDWLFRDVLKLQVAEGANTEPGPNRVQDRSQEHAQDLLEGVAALSDDEVERMFQEKMAGMRK
jgi:acyl transferase domain-containing protein/NADPH:quinone reductase-like Zn-dependent oxidoreductase/SAM-dependent methyltransferase/acyl carrier protein/NADP-dependent 3-hydroxy acid dehydrogenase YdfG